MGAETGSTTDRFSPKQNLYTLALSALSANWRFVLFVTFLLTFAEELGSMLDSAEDADAIWLDLAGFGVYTLAYVVWQVLVDIAILQTFLRGINGSQALLAAGPERIALYCGALILLMLIQAMVFVPFFLILFAVYGDISGLEAPMASMATASALLSLFLLGLSFPDIIARGRFAPRIAFGFGRTKRRRLGWLLLAGGAPFVFAYNSAWLIGDFDGALGAWPVIDFAELAGAVALNCLSALSSALFLAALYKVYAEAAPPDALPDGRRVAEVFD